MLSGHLRETIMRVYDTRPSTAESIMDIAEMVDSVAKREYSRGRKDQSEKSIQWIPCSERLPEDTVPVNITWVNREPEPYYSHIKDIPYTATGHYHNGKWWWYSATCQDYLDESGESEADRVDDAIEILAWQPLPPAYEGEKS